MKKQRMTAIAVLILLGVFSFFWEVAVAEDFSADLISKSEGQVFQGKIFFAKDKVRMETNEATTITRLDKSMMWMLMPDENMYMEMPLKSQNIVAGAKEDTG
jgi:outer membrane lipoprotein-sorting protein